MILDSEIYCLMVAFTMTFISFFIVIQCYTRFGGDIKHTSQKRHIYLP